jgi:CPA1 family monovalent cation:H+ antiporter
MTEIQLALLLIAIVIVITAVSRGLGASTPIAMVLGGLALSFVPGVPAVALPPELVFFGFLPPLLFAGGYFTSARDFKANLRPIILLAFGLVIFTAALVAAVTHTLIPSIGWAAAFALGGIVAPPDAVAATAIFQRLGVPRRIVTILEGESLVNDATALIIYRGRRHRCVLAARGVDGLRHRPRRRRRGRHDRRIRARSARRPRA